MHQQKKDRFKDKRCEEEGIYLIRIDRRYYNHENPEKLIAHIEEQLKKFMEVRGGMSKMKRKDKDDGQCMWTKRTFERWLGVI